MKLSSLLVAFGLAVGCGGDANPTLQDANPNLVDGKAPSDAPVDAAIAPATLTAFVIDLIQNHTDDPTPAAFATFSGLDDPDQTTNNVHAYDVLFP